MTQALVKSRFFRCALTVAAFSLFVATSGAQAHDLWVNAHEPAEGLVKAELGYGHDFPNPEPIAEDRIHIFAPIQIVTPEKTMELDQVGENYAYQGKAELKKGSYLVLGTYKPTFWSNGEGGWSQTCRLERPDATSCEEALMFAKTIMDVDGGRDKDFVSRPVGQALEIVPLVHPSTVRAGEKFPLQVFLNGKPAKTVEMEAVFAGFSDKNYKAFLGRTDLEGKIDLIPLRPGKWYAKVRASEPHPDPKRADSRNYYSVFSFSIDG